jgi:hypothetical protein
MLGSELPKIKREIERIPFAYTPEQRTNREEEIISTYANVIKRDVGVSVVAFLVALLLQIGLFIK